MKPAPLTATAWSDRHTDDSLSLFYSYPVLSVLVACVTAGMLAFYLLRQRRIQARRFANPPKMELIESLRLSAHGSLYLVDCGGRTLLVSTDARGIGSIQSVDLVPLPRALEGS